VETSCSSAGSGGGSRLAVGGSCRCTILTRERWREVAGDNLLRVLSDTNSSGQSRPVRYCSI